ncbi:MAG: hypothetical protein COT73_02380 [Bdellovibrio sp. CG10_big_fil_rev_8_21_14_0_10_47_8]|nr:MAG: hypothetical protein COT73_02380 [Bdellovibrio sp. CG10_big_fil_rev_8_21_14_0_10_47_8]
MMHKELNPELFGERGLKSRVVEEPPINQMVVLEKKVADNRQQMHQLAESMNRIVQQVNEFMKSTNHKFEKIYQALQRLESNDQALNLDSAQKISQIHNRLGERRTLEIKVQELVDRHNNVLKSYEVRMNQMQKLIAEREAQLISSQALLNETKMEIARLKRV